MIDPSDIYRPDHIAFAAKDVKDFRDFSVDENDPIKKKIQETYKKMHTYQTVDFVKGMNNVL